MGDNFDIFENNILYQGRKWNFEILLKKKDGKFFREDRKKNILLDPQPNESNLVELKRYYVKLQRDKSYENRISRFEKPHGYL